MSIILVSMLTFTIYTKLKVHLRQIVTLKGLDKLKLESDLKFHDGNEMEIITIMARIINILERNVIFDVISVRCYSQTK